jgi:UDP-N-acetylglucosamine 4,6-dehydratase
VSIRGRLLITGGTGSIGHAIIGRAVAEGWDAAITVYSRDEVKQAALAERFPGVRCLLGDVQDPEALGRAMRDIDVVIHAAAYKRVPEAERETLACINANVLGSANVVREALRSGSVTRVIGISTDKACAPVNAYGMSKALMERTFQSVRDRAVPAFTLTRYGNVLASRGSVIPALRAQAERSGRVTLTDPEMTRFWLTLDDAVDLIEDAAKAPSGSITVPRSRSATMATVAVAVVPGIPVDIVGIRDGEKRHEMLVSEHEAPYLDVFGRHMRLLPLSGAGGSGQGPYGSFTAPRLSAADLRTVIGEMDAGRPVRTLP